MSRWLIYEGTILSCCEHQAMLGHVLCLSWVLYLFARVQVDHTGAIIHTWCTTWTTYFTSIRLFKVSFLSSAHTLWLYWNCKLGDYQPKVTKKDSKRIHHALGDMDSVTFVYVSSSEKNTQMNLTCFQILNYSYKHDSSALEEWKHILGVYVLWTLLNWN